MDSNFDRLIDRSETSSQKWQRYAGRDILPLWVADTDFLSPPEVIEALKERVEHGVFGYTDTPEQLNHLFIKRMRDYYDWHLTSEDLIWLPGLVCGLNLATRAATNPGEGVITGTPVYPPFVSAPLLSERDLIKIPLERNPQRLLLAPDELASKRDPQSKLLLFCNPHNPGGTVYRRSELETLASEVIEQDLLICSDEIHADLILEPGVKHTPIASLNPEIAARTITLMAPSKTWNIAGLGCSVAIIQNPALRARFKRVRKGIVPDVNLLGYTAAQAAYEADEQWLTSKIEYLRGTRDYLIKEINQIPGMKLEPFEATYLAWIDVSALGLEDPKAFFEAAGVGLSPGSDFGDPQAVRLNFGSPRSVIEEAVSRIRHAVETLT